VGNVAIAIGSRSGNQALEKRTTTDGRQWSGTYVIRYENIYTHVREMNVCEIPWMLRYKPMMLASLLATSKARLNCAPPDCRGM
jgi:hypothetical protein